MSKITVYKRQRNHGFSFGLQYPYLYGEIVHGIWWIWHRHTGEVVWIAEGKYPIWDQHCAMKKCLELNGL